MEPTQRQPVEAPTAPWLTPQPEPSEQSAVAKQRGGWKRLALPAALAAGGLLVGAGVGAGVMAGVADPTQSEEYAALEQDLADAEEKIDSRDGRIVDLNDRVREIREEATTEAQRQAQAQAALDQRERDVKEREEAVTVTEEQIAARSVGPGIWTVGVDIEPGTYRTEAPVLIQCYWGIYRTGSNGSDIIDNDIVSGGFPQVTSASARTSRTRAAGRS